LHSDNNKKADSPEKEAEVNAQTEFPCNSEDIGFDVKQEIEKPIQTKEQVYEKKLVWTLTPSNLEEQERLFFENGCTKNPQFTYGNSKLITRMIKLFQKPKGNLLGLAVNIIESFLKNYISESKFLEDYGGNLMTKEETTEIFQSYIDNLGLSHHITIQFSYNTVSPTSIIHDPKNSQSVIVIGLPIDYRKNRIKGVLNHEIGTHFIRKYNDKKQPWSASRTKYNLKNYIATEEGFASLNQLYEQVLLSSIYI